MRHRNGEAAYNPAEYGMEQLPLDVEDIDDEPLAMEIPAETELPWHAKVHRAEQIRDERALRRLWVDMLAIGYEPTDE